MPEYPFQCSHCSATTNVVRYMRESSDPLTCCCGTPMNRVYTVPHAQVPLTGYYNHALGQYVGNRQDVKDAMRRIHDTQGREIVEVGDQKVKPPSAKHDVTKVVRETAEKWTS